MLCSQSILFQTHVIETETLGSSLGWDTASLVQVVARVKAQSQRNVRALEYDASRNMLVTAGFDRTVNFFLQYRPAVQIS